MRKKHVDARKILGRFRKQISVTDRRLLRAWKRGILKLAKKQKPIKRIQPITRPLLRYSYNHARISSGFCALLVLVTAAIPMLQQVYLNRRYVLDAQSEALVGKSFKTLDAKLVYDPAKQLYQFNKDGYEKAQQAKDTSDPVAKLMSAQVGGENDKNAKQLYSLNLSENLDKGITVYDNNLGLSFTMKPEFNSSLGRMVDGHLVYPIDGGQAVYTLRGNGLKEDILLKQAPDSGRLNLSYDLKLPAELEARPLGDGGIGIFSADPTLYGDISYGDSATQFKVMMARKNSPKDNLVFTLPAPFIKQSDQKAAPSGNTNFVLRGSKLSLQASQLEGLSYPISIDPAVTVDSTSGLFAGNNETNMDIDTTNSRMDRGGLTSGSVGTWSAGTSFTTARTESAMVAYNGYLYILGGKTGTSIAAHYADVQYASIGSNGVLGSWAATTSMPYTLSGMAAVAYNGYIYTTGGEEGDDGGGNYVGAMVQYGKINTTNGTITSWTQTTSLSAARENHSMAAYNGYLYAIGGSHTTFTDTSCNTTSSTLCSDVIYASVNGNGSVGAWASTAALGATRYSEGAAAYNGYLYVFGGNVGATNSDNSVLYAPINTNGTIGSWVSTTSMSTGRRAFVATIYNGYIYAIGGIDSSSAYSNTVSYAQVNANGTVGSWANTTTYSVGRGGVTGAAYNGYLYLGAGQQGTSGACASGVTYCNDTQYTKFDQAGVTMGYGTTTALPDTGSGQSKILGARVGHAAVAYNGYLYVLGGGNPSNGSNVTYSNDVKYAQISSTGTVGTWTSNANKFTTGRENHSVVIYNGYIFVLGGTNSAFTSLNDVQYALICTSFNSGNGGCTGTAGSIGTWTTTSSFITGRSFLGAAAYGGYMYIYGGQNTSGTPLNDVQYAAIGTSGLGTWHYTHNSTDDSTTFVSGLTYTHQIFGAVATGGYLYALGGSSGSSAGFVEYAPLNSNGTVGTWTTASATMLSFTGGNTVVYNGYMYVVGDANFDSASLTYAPINNDGSTGSWTSLTSFSSARAESAAALYNGYVYFIGGENSGTGTYLSDVQYARVTNGGDGTVGTWASTSSFTGTRRGHTSVAYKGYMYVLGGTNGTYTNDVQYAPINSNGTLGTWHYTHNSTDDGTSFVAGFTTPRQGFSSVVYNGYLYVIGGNQSTSTTACTGTASQYLCDVQYAPLNTNGTVGTWASTSSFTNARYLHASVAYNGYMYVIAGFNGTTYYNDVQYAPINSTGTLGAWHYTHNSTDDSTSFVSGLTSGRYGLSAVVYNGYVYAIGGLDSGSNYKSDVYYAPLNSNGTIGTWKLTGGFINGRELHASVAYNGYLYVIGGNFGSTNFNDTQMAPINSNGTIGSWVMSSTFTNNRMGLPAVAYNGYLYILGGTNGSLFYNDVMYAPLNAISRTGTYSKLIDLGSNMGLSSITSLTGIPDANYTYKAWDADGTTVAGSGLASSVTSSGGGGGTCGSGGGGGSVTARYVWLKVVLDDSMSGSFADASGSSSNVSTMTVNYTSGSSSGHPPPNQRLRGGMVLQAGGTNNLQLDTCGV